MIEFNEETGIYTSDGRCEIFVNRGDNSDKVKYEHQLPLNAIITVPEIDPKKRFIVTRGPYFDLELPEGTKCFKFKEIGGLKNEKFHR